MANELQSELSIVDKDAVKLSDEDKTKKIDQNINQVTKQIVSKTEQKVLQLLNRVGSKLLNLAISDQVAAIQALLASQIDELFNDEVIKQGQKQKTIILEISPVKTKKQAEKGTFLLALLGIGVAGLSVLAFKFYINTKTSQNSTHQKPLG